MTTTTILLVCLAVLLGAVIVFLLWRVRTLNSLRKLQEKEKEELRELNKKVEVAEALEEQLREAKRQAEESSRLKSSFLSNMSHEIRTPLSAIVGFSELLVHAGTEEERTEYVHIIENNSDLLLQLVNDILDLSKIEAGTVEFTYTDFDLNKLMKEIYDAMQLRLTSEEKPVTLSYTTGMEPCTIHSERNRLTQLITNLLTNALKFTERGTVSFGYERRGDLLHFQVKDTGCGIAPERQKDIFDRFVKLSSHKQGTGLGLSICKSIAETLGGQIGVESEPGKGSTFWFDIPYRPAKEQAQPKTQSQKRGGGHVQPVPSAAHPDGHQHARDGRLRGHPRNPQTLYGRTHIGAHRLCLRIRRGAHPEQRHEFVHVQTGEHTATAQARGNPAPPGVCVPVGGKTGDRNNKKMKQTIGNELKAVTERSK